jgi:hypothetical protein
MTTEPGKPTSIRAVIIMVVCVVGLSVVAMFLFNWAMFGDHSEFHTGLAHYEGLPASASDITVYRNRNISGTFVADFKISEPDFVAFAREKHLDVKPISRPEEIFHAKAFHERRVNEDRKRITDGLFYSNFEAAIAAYDRHTGRAYVYFSSR